tara:strand:- start:716 stop:1036 length:321 start_codon:yes stop_codon:yes gene_type:complete
MKDTPWTAHDGGARVAAGRFLMDAVREEWKTRADACRSFDEMLALAQEVFNSHHAIDAERISAKSAVNALEEAKRKMVDRNATTFAQSRFGAFRMAIGEHIGMQSA